SIVKSILLIVTENHSMKFSLHKESAKELLFFGGGYTIARISNHFALQADNLVVGKWLGANFLGLYNRAYQLMVMPANLFGDRKSTRLNSSHVSISYAVFCLKKKIK